MDILRVCAFNFRHVSQDGRARSVGTMPVKECLSVGNTSGSLAPDRPPLLEPWHNAAPTSASRSPGRRRSRTGWACEAEGRGTNTTFFSKEGLFLLRVQGSGDLFLSSYGAIHTKELRHGEKYIVDTGHMVAFDESVNYRVTRVGGLKSTFFSGEGLVCELTGPGNIYLQSRSDDAFLTWLIPRIPKRS